MRIAEASALVTGGAGGLGKATARRLAAAGAKVVIADLDDERAGKLVAELGPSARYVRTDVTSEADVGEAIAAAQALGPLRVVVNSHGGPVAAARVVSRHGVPMPQESFDRTVRLYLSGTFNVMRLAAASMACLEPGESGVRGLVVNTASIAAFEGQVGQSDYSAAKGGVVGMGLVAARDLAPFGIRVMTIAPGTFYTPAYRMDLESAEKAWGSTVPFPRRMGRADEFAQLVMAIVDNDYLNGETIRIDGAQRFGLK